MGTTKYLCWVLVALMFLSVVSGGCGGGGSGGIVSNTPNNTTPNTPNTQDNLTENTYAINEITGTWVASNGTGTATGPDGTFSLAMIYCSATFGNISTTGSSTTTTASASATWDAYQSDVYVRTIPLNYSNETITITNMGTNTWRYTFPSLESKITVKLTSRTTADVTEEGNFVLGSYTYQYVATYTMTKQ